MDKCGFIYTGTSEDLILRILSAGKYKSCSFCVLNLFSKRSVSRVKQISSSLYHLPLCRTWQRMVNDRIAEFFCLLCHKSEDKFNLIC